MFRQAYPGERPLFAAPALLALFSLFGAAVTRVLLAARVESVPFSESPGHYIHAFALGYMNDILVAAILFTLMTAPFALVARLSHWRAARIAGHLLFLAVTAAILFQAVAEVFFWEEFDARFNGIAVFYLLYPREVIGNLQESFNLYAYLPLFLAGALLLWWFSYGSLKVTFKRLPPSRGRLARTLLAVAPGLLAAISFSVEPRSLDGNRELDQLAHDGLQSMATAALTNDAVYEGHYPTLPHEEALAALRSLVEQDNTRFIGGPGDSPVLRHVENPGPEKRLNVVLVTEESYGSVFVDSLDNRLQAELSPDLEKLASQGLFFTNIYAQGDRTVRGLEATETGFAPIPGISTARRANADGMDSLPHLLGQRGWETGVLYGGLNSFDNMGAFWRGIDYQHVWDQRDIRHESFSTIWGVSDQDLFTEALSRMDEMTADGSPAFLTLMTVSNHRPYKFPEGELAWDDSIGKVQNTARYAQWAFADFLEQAKTKPWFRDTVFVFVADHSVKINGAARVPVQAFRIPLLFYSPAHIEPARVATLGAQIDLVPTLLGLLNMSYDSPFFGLDLRRVPEGEGRIAIAHNFSIAFGRKGHLVVLEPNGPSEGYSFAPGLEPLQAEAPDPDTLRLAVAQTQEAHRAFYEGRYHWRQPSKAETSGIAALLPDFLVKKSAAEEGR